MILECSECRARYIVPDSAIGAEGRVVRCAACRHSWFQEPAALDLVDRAAIAPAATDAPAPPTFFEREPAPAGEQEPGPDPFAHEPPFRPRRNPARRLTIVAAAVGLAMLVAVGAIQYFGTPGLAAQLGLPIGEPDVPLRFANYSTERRDLDSGNELFVISGQVVNPTAIRQRVPDILAELRDAQGRLVFSWTIAPEQRTLRPRESIQFDSAKLDVPNNSKKLTLTFAGDAAP